MAYNREHYYVKTFDPEATASYMPEGHKGMYVAHSEHETFEGAFAEWKRIFPGSTRTPYIEKDGRSIFNGYAALDSKAPTLDVDEAKKIAAVNENWKF